MVGEELNMTVDFYADSIPIFVEQLQQDMHACIRNSLKSRNGEKQLDTTTM